MALLLDIEQLSDADSDEALETIYKAIGDGDEESLWSEHPSPFIRRLIELFTQRGLLRLAGLQEALEKWEERKQEGTDSQPPRPERMMLRWTPEEIELVRLYLTSIPTNSFALEDHMLLVDYLVQVYLPANEMRTEAEWLATRAVLMGRVQANLDEEQEITPSQADALIEAMPSTPVAAMEMFPSTSAQEAAAMEYTNARVAMNVQKITDDVRHKMRSTIIEHVQEQKLAGSPKGPSLQSKLNEKFGSLNRDMRRIAVTETGEAMNQSLVASLPKGSFVKRVERYKGACPFCRRIDGVVVEVVAADAPVKDPETQIWPGKDNIGRSASPRKRSGGSLIARADNERWQIPAGTVHPNCRGRWIKTMAPVKKDDDEFTVWLKNHLNPKK